MRCFCCGSNGREAFCSPECRSTGTFPMGIRRQGLVLALREEGDRFFPARRLDRVLLEEHVGDGPWTSLSFEQAVSLVIPMPVSMFGEKAKDLGGEDL
jgi:hypothetical protein